MACFLACQTENYLNMVIYSVQWFVDKNLTKGKGRLGDAEYYIIFSVLCRTIADAQRCFNWVFEFEFPWRKHQLSPDDGVLTMKREKVDSRHFEAKYLMFKDMKMPLNLHDINGSLFQMIPKIQVKY